MSTHADVLVETRDLVKTYGPSVKAVDEVNLTVRRGEVYGFLGPNGAGKTTTLRMLVGLVRPTSGRVTVLGRPPGAPDGLARIGTMIESPAFYPYLSGRDNLRVLARYRLLPRRDVEVVLARVDLTDRADDRYDTYSLGMKQRLGVAAALLGEPELFILDEPTNGLDPAGMRDMRALVCELGENGHTVLLSSHLLAEVQQICGRVGVISGGRLIAESTVDELRGQAGLRVVANPLERAVEQVRRVVGTGVVEVRDGAIRIQADPARAPRIVRELVAADVQVMEVGRMERTLEEAFLEMTGDQS